jgi:hypothetical protein
MMISNFNIVFSIRIFHEYFENNNCNCLVFSATENTNQLIKRYGFKIKKNGNGFDFYTTNQDDLVSYLNYIEQTVEQNHFQFEINTSKSNFTIFTDIPTNWMGQLQYSSNNLLFINGKAELIPTYSVQSSTVVLGTLCVFFQDLIKLIKNKSTSTFDIRFQARTTQWQYYIINNSGMPLNNLVIQGKSAIDFGLATSVTIQNGREALLFSSGEQFIEMSEVPKYQFDLIDQSKTTGLERKPNGGRMIFKGLPNPNPNQIETKVINGASIATSAMYVYI